MKIKKLTYVLFLTLGVLFASCSKEKGNPTDIEKPLYQTQYDILAFDNQADFANQLEQISQMDNEELINFQNSNNYQSYGIFCDELYSNIAADSLNLPLLLSNVSSNSSYLELIINNSNDTTLASRYGNTPFYYIMNINRMYIVDQLVYKVFDEGQLCCNISNYDNLLNVSEENLSSYLSNPDYTFVYFLSKENNEAKDNAYNVGIFKDVRATNGKNRTLTQVQIYLMANSPSYQFGNWQLVRPYKKTLGIWYWCKRTITADFKTAIDLPDVDGINYRQPYNNSKTKSAYKIDFLDVFFRVDPYNTTFPHYAGYRAYGDTPSTDPATFSANTSIL